MVSDGAVRSTLARVTALIVAVLLAVSGLTLVSPAVAADTAGSATHPSSMDAPLGPVVAGVLKAAPCVSAAPVSATSRVVVAFAIMAERLPASRSARPAGALRPAPAILRI